MNRIELQKSDLTESHGNGELQTALHVPARENAGFPHSAAMHENGGEQSAPKPSARRRRIVGTSVALILIGGLVLGFLPRWRQRRTATADMNQLAIPTVSVVSPTAGKSGNGLVLPAEIRPMAT
jgi:hypothetical protein